MPTDSRFCHECGVPLVELSADEATPLAGDRRPITVLFVDALSATGDLGRLDPEEVHAMLERLLEAIGRGIEQFDGTIDRFTGHGLKGLFGAPVAQENHAALACHAALDVARRLEQLSTDLERRHGIRLRPRMGIHSAEAVLGSIGHGPAGSDFLTQGRTAALASRIEQATDPGEIWLSEQTAELVSDYFDLRDLGPVGLRGLDSAQHLFALEGTGSHASRFDARRARGLTPFVGRDQELEHLEEAYRRAQSAGPVRIAILGEAGIGKTRLCEEFTRRCEARGVAVYTVRGIESARWRPFAAAARFLRTHLGLPENGNAPPARAHAREALLTLDPSLEDALPDLLALLGLEDGAKSRKKSVDPDAQVALIARVILALFVSRATRLPTVFILDDCRWLDPGTASLAALFFRWGRSGPFLFLASDRDEIDPTWQENARFEHMDLEPLDEDSSLALVHSRLGRAAELQPLATRIGERGAGNPFFLEELIETVASRDLQPGAQTQRRGRRDSEDDLPATVHAVLSARIDRLAEEERALLRAAAVIGREFDEPTLRDVAASPNPDPSGALARLVEAGFLTRVARERYEFRHPLLREAAYRFLLDEQRRHLHGAVTRSLIRRNEDRLDEYAALLAYHCEAAGRVLHAVRWHCRAGTFLGLKVPLDASRHWQKALELTALLPDDDEVSALATGAAIRTLQLGAHLGIEPKDAAACFAMGRRHAERIGEDSMLALLQSAYGSLRSLYGTEDEAAQHAREASEIASRTTDAHLDLVLRSRLALSLFRSGHLEAALELTRVPLPPAFQPSSSVDLVGIDAALHLRVLQVNVLVEMGRIEGLREDLLEIAETAERAGESSILAWAWTSFSVLARAHGADPAEAARAAHRAIAVVATGGNRMTRTPPLLALGISLTESGRVHEARTALERALASVRVGGPTVILEASILTALSRAVARCGDPLRAERLALEALALATARGARLYEIDARLCLASTLVTSGRPSRAARASHELDLAERLMNKTGAIRAQAELADLRARLDQNAVPG